MRHLLQKPKEFIFLLATAFFFFLLRLPSLYEPHWYGDEGIYETIGYALRHGRSLYTGIWDNKPPLLYLFYALVNGDQFSIKLLSLIFGLIEIGVFYFLAKRLFTNARARYLSTGFFALLYALPILEGNIANAENFMLLPILTAAYLIVTKFNTDRARYNSRVLFSSGILLGLAALFKMVALFDLLAFVMFLLSFHLPALSFSQRSLTIFAKTALSKLRTLTPLLSGFLLPILITSLYFLIRGAFAEFFHAVFAGNVGYVGLENTFVFPQGLLVAKIILLGVFIVAFFWKKALFGRVERFILLWVGLSIFSAFFSQRPYTHYLLVLLPSFSLAVGLLPILRRRAKTAVAILLLTVVVMVLQSFRYYSPTKSVAYYSNFISYLEDTKDSTSYEAFFDSQTPSILNVASYLRLHVRKNEPIFVWGDFPQLYRLTETLPPGRFTVAYHIIPSQKNTDETLKALAMTRPRYIVILPNLSYIPFNLNSYSKVVTIDTITIYERTF